MTEKISYFILAFLINSFVLVAQKKETTKAIDSLIQETYSTLSVAFNSPKTTDKEAFSYAKAFLQKATLDNDLKKRITGYYYLALIANDATKIAYADSILAISDASVDHLKKEEAFVLKGATYYKRKAYKKALDLYLKALPYAQKSKNENILFTIEYNIGILHGHTDEHQKSLQALKKCYAYINRRKLPNKKIQLTVLSALATAYRKNKKLDSATYYNKLGIKIAQKSLNFKDEYYHFILKEGVNQFDKKNYTTAKDSLDKSIPHLKDVRDISNLAYAYFYLGKIYYDLNNQEKAVSYFKKVDTIFLQDNDLFPEARESYLKLISYYKSKNDTQKQLVYTKRLVSLDSTLNDNQYKLSSKIQQKYDIPKLLQIRNQIISNLEKQKYIGRRNTYIAIGIIIIISLFLFYQYRKKRIYKKRFESLMAERNSTPKANNDTLLDTNNLNIPQEIVTSIVQNLDLFKKENGFLASDITLQKLAKEFQTNHTYLSKVINNYEEKSFNVFINDLRINYTINRLRTDFIFRKYTIDAIAEEAGFSNTRTFSRAFQRITNLTPSYFIKSLKSS